MTVVDRPADDTATVEPVSNRNQGVIDGLREIADLLERHPEMPDVHAFVSHWAYGSGARNMLGLVASCLPNPAERITRSGDDVQVFEKFGDVELYAQAFIKDLGAKPMPVPKYQYKPILPVKEQR